RVQRPPRRPHDAHLPDRRGRPGLRLRPQSELHRLPDRDLARAAEPRAGRATVVHADGPDRTVTPPRTKCGTSAAATPTRRAATTTTTFPAASSLVRSGVPGRSSGMRS